MKANNKTYSDDEIIALLKNNKTASEGIKYIYTSHFETLSWFVQKNGGSLEDAQDIFQEVVVAFIQLVQQQKFRGESSIKTFLFSLNRNIWFNELKRKGRALEREKKYELSGEKEVKAEAAIEQREASTELLKIMNSLGESCKKILVLFYFENYSMKEILSTLNYENEQVVRNKKYKCLKKLEEMMQAQKGLWQQLKNLLHG